MCIRDSLLRLPLARCIDAVSYTHLRAHETLMNLVCRLLLEKSWWARWWGVRGMTTWGRGVVFFKQKTAYEIHERLVGSEMCIRDRYEAA